MVQAGEIHEVVPGLYVWQVYDPACKADVTSTAYVLNGRIVLLDPVRLGQEPLSELLARGEPAAIILTNGNHERAARELAQRWKVPVWSHPEAARALSFRNDADLREGQELFQELMVKVLPGGGPGEIAVYHSRTKSLSFGDLVINLPGFELQLLPAKYCQDVRQARISLRTLSGLEVARMTFAHGLPVVRNAGERLCALIQSVSLTTE